MDPAAPSNTPAGAQCSSLSGDRSAPRDHGSALPGEAVPLPDAACVEQVLAGHTRAYGLLYDRYVRFVHAMCYDVAGDVGLAQDLTQEVFLRAYRDLQRLRRAEQFAGWVRGITHRVCRDWVRKRARERRHLSDLEASESVPADRHSEDERLQQLRIAIAGLPEKERAALHLFYLENEATERACEILRLSRSGFYRVLERARKRLERLLRDRQET